MKLLGSRENAVFLAKMSLTPHFLFYHYHYLAAPDHRLLHAVEELEEAFLAPQNKAGSMGLADEDAALAKPERTIARLHHGTRKGIKLFQTPEHMTLARQSLQVSGRGRKEDEEESSLIGSRKSIWREKHLHLATMM